MAPAVGHVLPVGGEDLHRFGGLIEGDAQGAGDVAGEKGRAIPGVEQHEHPSSVLHLVLDGVDPDLAETLVFVVGLEPRQLLGRRFHARTSLLSMERLFLTFLQPTSIPLAASPEFIVTTAPSGSSPQTHSAFPPLSLRLSSPPVPLSPRLSSPPVPLSLRLSSPPVPLSLRERGDYEMIPGSPR